MALSCHFAKRAAICSSFFSSPSPLFHHLAVLSTPLSTEAHPQKDLPFVTKYLISSFGFSPDRALKYSAHRNLAAIKSSARPEVVVKFLSETGLSDTQIKAAVSLYPLLLSYNVERTLKPKVCQLMDVGFSRELLVEMIPKNPQCLCLKNTLPHLLFWRDFVGGNDHTLLKIVQRNGLLLTRNVDQHVVPRINLLKECGLSNPDIVSLIQKQGRYMTQNLDSLRQTIELIEELGILRSSNAFWRALKAVGSCRKDAIKRKMEFLKRTYGWSQEDVSSTFKKDPTLLALSETTVKSKMDFLVMKAGFEPTSVASNPHLIRCSLERVLIPRNNVMRTLEAKGLKKNCSLSTVCKMSERYFCEKYVVPFEKVVPELKETYVADLGLKVQI